MRKGKMNISPTDSNTKRIMTLKRYTTLFALIILIFQTSPASAQQADLAQALPLSLSEAIQKSLENNYGILISKNDAEIAGINNSWGQAGKYPTIDLNLATNNNLSMSSDLTSGTNRLTGGVGMRWVLFNGFKVQITKDRLESLEELAQGRTAVVIENTIQDVIEAYYYALMQLERRSVYQKVLELSGLRYQAEEGKRKDGVSLTYQVLQAKNSFLGDQFQLLSQEILVKTTMRNLNFLLAEDANALWKLTDPFTHEAQQYIADDLLAKIKSNNHTIQNQFINIEINKENRKLADASFFPSVSLSTGLDNSFTNQFIPGEGNQTGSGMSPYANISLAYNIYSGGSRLRARQIADINQTVAQTESSEMIHLVSNQLLNELDTYNIRMIQLDVATEGVISAELNMSIADDKLRSGTINSFNYRDIQLIYLNAALQKVQAIYALIQSHTNLTRLSGGFVEE